MQQQLVLEQITTKDLHSLICLAVGQALEMHTYALFEAHPQLVPEVPAILTRAEAARYLRISMPSLHRRVKDGDLQPVRVGKRVLFRRSDLDTLLEGSTTVADGRAQ